MSENLIERYLTDLAETRGTRSNVAETSFYPALERLLTEIGKTLSPRVRCVIHIADRGAGLPDAGLFTVDQFKRHSHDPDAPANPFLIQNPARGVIEAKPPKGDLDAAWARQQRAAKSAPKTAFAAAMRETPATYTVAGTFDWRSAHFLLRVPML
jgi:hypothetical protein